MSVVDKIIAKVTPPESEAARVRATEAARAASQPGDWLSTALDHHDRIRAAFVGAGAAVTPEHRKIALQVLARELNGHSLAEELVLYPALAQAGHKAHAAQAYTEQTAAKMQMAELENIDPGDDAWRDKLGHIEGAVLHHMFEEERGWFLELRQGSGDQARLALRYLEEYQRYVGSD
jgi:iron-sulfur cluster repair protein YtfE (RIC family)